MTATLTNPLTLTETMIVELRAAFFAKGRAKLTATFSDLARHASGRSWINNQSTVTLSSGAKSLKQVSIAHLHARPAGGYGDDHVYDRPSAAAWDFELNIHIRIEDLLRVQLRDLGLDICGSETDADGNLNITVF
ncbi:hypothetical protein [Cryobacterium sp. CG_9.6]|uniref:hypothetical protein n=1 Tax=Cryobacterium sp. CG_9.6 TaxID=2760710 RepID=UPI002474C7DF|nr:hypothetical protein [Cryobacterium sp. CG_9.6]MDH6236291.1 hypothetical protein [Cryobacterium sp. CG_9.6]